MSGSKLPTVVDASWVVDILLYRCSTCFAITLNIRTGTSSQFSSSNIQNLMSRYASSHLNFPHHGLQGLFLLCEAGARYHTQPKDSNVTTYQIHSWTGTQILSVEQVSPNETAAVKCAQQKLAVLYLGTISSQHLKYCIRKEKQNGRQALNP